MQDGRVSFTAEKATDRDGVFYQLAGPAHELGPDRLPPAARAARAVDRHLHDTTCSPSVDYQQATEIREGLDRNFLIILSDVGAKGGGGALATFNRSIGPFQADRTEVTFVRSVKIVDPAATGKAGTAGVYRSPFSLPNGEILASYDGAVTDPAARTPHYALVAVNDQTGAAPHAGQRRHACRTSRRRSGYKRGERLLFTNLPQLVFGGHTGATARRHRRHALPRRCRCWRRCWARTCASGRNVAGHGQRPSRSGSTEESPPPTPRTAARAQMVYRQPHARSARRRSRRTTR